MAGSRPCHPPATKKRCEELVRQGTSVANIVARLGVSKSYVKRVVAEVNGTRKETEDNAD